MLDCYPRASSQASCLWSLALIILIFFVCLQKVAVHHGLPPAATAASRPKTPGQHVCPANSLPTLQTSAPPDRAVAQNQLVSNCHSQHGETHFGVMSRLLSLFIRQSRCFGLLVKQISLDRFSGRCVYAAREPCWLHGGRHGSGESSEKPSTTRLNCDFVISGSDLSSINTGA